MEVKEGARTRMKGLLGFIPEMLRLLYRLVRDPRVSRQDRLILLAAISYALAPLDFLPDYIPFFGHVDDVYLIALSLLRLLNRTDASVLREHWRGPGDIVEIARAVTKLAVFFLPRRARRAILRFAS